MYQRVVDDLEMCDQYSGDGVLQILQDRKFLMHERDLEYGLGFLLSLMFGIYVYKMRFQKDTSLHPAL